MSNSNAWWSSRDDDTNGYNINKTFMVVALICLFVVVIAILVLHIYARCLIQRQFRRSANLRGMAVGSADAETHAHEPPKTGLDPSVIATLPTFAYRKSDGGDDAGVDCAICLTALEEGETARLLPNCRHVFHLECIDMWLHSNSTCPICRSGAEPRAPEERGEPAMLPPEPLEGGSDEAGQSSKVGGSGPRLSSFRRMLSRERSDRRLQTDVVEDLERQ